MQSNWKTVNLGEIAAVQTGPFGSQLHESDYVKDGTPIITVENLIDGKIQFTPTTPLVSPTDVNRLSKYTLKEGDVVFSRVGAVDRSAYCTSEAEGWMFSGRILRVRPKSMLNPKFLDYYLTLDTTKNRIRNHAVGGTMPSLNTTILNDLPVAYPPLIEQEQIVMVLETWDAYLKYLDLKIANKQRIQKALVDELLSGKKRLPGFGEDWNQYKIKDIFSFISTASHSKDQMTYGVPESSDAIHNIHYGDIHSRYSDYIDFQHQNVPSLLVAPHTISPGKFLEEGDVVIADASEDYAGVGECVEILNLSGKKCIAGLHTFALRHTENNVAIGYGALIFKNEDVRNRMRRVATYSKVYGITKASFENVIVDLPPYEEQIAIARVLGCSMKEKDALMTLREAVRKQRKYLRKKLITGELTVHDMQRETAKESSYA